MPVTNVIIDLSHHNNVVDFKKIKAAGIAGVIHKATQGFSYTDPTYAARRKAALAAGLMWGAYHFGEGGDGEQQADFFLSVVKPGPRDLLVLDFEANPAGSSMGLHDAELFVSHVQAVTGHWPGFYSGTYLKQILTTQTSTILPNCWFWLAQYGNTAVVPSLWPYYSMWQYTDGAIGPDPHSVDGVGTCDRDKFNGSLNQLKKLWGY